MEKTKELAGSEEKDQQLGKEPDKLKEEILITVTGGMHSRIWDGDTAESSKQDVVK